MLGALTHIAGPAEPPPREAGHTFTGVSGSVHGLEMTWLRFRDTRQKLGNVTRCGAGMTQGHEVT